MSQSRLSAEQRMPQDLMNNYVRASLLIEMVEMTATMMPHTMMTAPPSRGFPCVYLIVVTATAKTAMVRSAKKRMYAMCFMCSPFSHLIFVRFFGKKILFNRTYDAQQVCCFVHQFVIPFGFPGKKVRHSLIRDA